MQSRSAKNNITAFTLVELLVVIAIIGILSGLVVVQMNGAITVANDAKRKANLDTIRKALTYNGALSGVAYPIQTTECNIGGITNACPVALTNFLSSTLPSLPVDPVSGYYTYLTDATGSSFTISAVLSASTLTYNSETKYATGPIDIDGNAYAGVTIGTQTWMTSNLMTTRYADGTAIERGSPTSGSWDGADHAYYAYPPTPSSGVEESWDNIKANKLGFIYQWSTTVNTHGLCPTGWHVPTDPEFCTLEQTVDPSASCLAANPIGTDVGDKLKETGIIRWKSGNGGTNLSGFTAIGPGYRNPQGVFSGRNSYGHFWTTRYVGNLIALPGATAYNHQFSYNVSKVSHFAVDRGYAFSVRCLKD